MSCGPLIVLPTQSSCRSWRYPRSAASSGRVTEPTEPWYLMLLVSGLPVDAASAAKSADFEEPPEAQAAAVGPSTAVTASRPRKLLRSGRRAAVVATTGNPCRL